MIELDPIGSIETPFDTPDEAPRQGENRAAVGTIKLKEEYRTGLDGVSPGEEFIVIWFADKADRTRLNVDRGSGSGVFTSRSPSRPNPVCLTTCRVVEISEEGVKVRGVDMVDGSPVLDLKPPLD